MHGCGGVIIFLSCTQTVEKWTLREIHEKMHSGAGIPSSMSKSSGQSSSSSNPPPPIPARRLASHPPMAPGGGGSSAGGGGGKTDGQLAVNDKDTTESRSAPSSPTEKEKDVSASLRPERVTIGSPRPASRSHGVQRPRSVVVDMSSALNYAQVQFTNGHGGAGRPKITQRRNTKYTSISYQPENSAGKKSKDEAAAQDNHVKTEAGNGQQQQTSSSARSSDYHSHHESSPRASPAPPAADNSAPMYDVPPPIPVRLDLLDSEEGSGSSVGQASGSGGDSRGGGDGEKQPTALHRRHSSDPFHGTDGTDPFSGQADPFSNQDPFSGGASSAWEDPAAFYDKPPQRQPVPARSDSAESPAKSGGNSSSFGQGFDDSFINSTDFTGESSYEDTCEVLKNLRMMKNSMGQGTGGGGHTEHYAPASEVFMGGADKANRAENHGPGGGGGNGGAGIEQSSPDLSCKVGDSYEFPTELAKYPLKQREATPTSMPEAPPPKTREEPTLHTFNYSSKTQASCPISSGPGGVARQESFNRSSRNMPLPPIPGETPPPPSQHNLRQQPSVDHAPPLPARTNVSTGKPPLPGNHPAMRKQVEDPPRLPPLNHPWGNKRHPIDNATPTADNNPPLPPRKKETSLGIEMPGASPQSPPQQQSPAQRKEELALRELLALGYTKAEIERALKITRNDYTMAKMILQEFGGRH